MSEYTTSAPKIKTRAEYIFDAEYVLGIADHLTARSFPTVTDFLLARHNEIAIAQVYATLALAAPEAASPPDYLSVCAERDALRQQRDELQRLCKEADRLFDEYDSLDAMALQEEPDEMSVPYDRWSREAKQWIVKFQNAGQTSPAEATK